MKLFCMCMLCMALFSSHLMASPATVEANLKQKHPELRVKQLQPTPVEGLYSANLDGNVVYVSEDAEFIMAGGVMIRLKDQRNLTQDLVLTQNKIDWQKLPLQDAIKTVQGNGQRQIAIFSDPNCPHCQRFESELAQLKNVTIYTFIWAIKPQSVAPSEAVWCSKDPKQAWHNLIGKGLAPPTATCANPIARNIALAQTLELQGTPVLIFSNGFVSQGAHAHQDIEELWQTLGL